MAWVYLGLAGLLEVVWASSLKQSAGFTRLVPTAITAVAMLGSIWLLALAMRALPLGTYELSPNLLDFDVVLHSADVVEAEAGQAAFQGAQDAVAGEVPDAAVGSRDVEALVVLSVAVGGEQEAAHLGGDGVGVPRPLAQGRA